MKKKNFCIFIISNGRPSSIITLNTLRKSNYTGDSFIVCDNEDETIGEYKKNYGADKVLVFNKKEYAQKIDNCDNFQNRRTTTHARNACFDCAEKLGYDYFLVLDDDYTRFAHNFNKEGKFLRSNVTGFDKLCEICLDFLDADKRIKSVCFIQGGDLVGGESSLKGQPFPFKRRKAMNSFFCKTKRRFWFFSRLNEDVNTYLELGKKGDIFFSIPEFALNQKQTQSNAGGMSDAYLEGGTYVKSFYTVMINPSFAKANYLPSMNRIHHKISWNNAIPKILDERNKKQ
tara:strand:- start:2170 stop:3030 length:861 start_codon:yes stop_codon:yes gene_type:complete